MSKGTLSPELLQKIKDSVSMIEVVGEHVVLRKTGAHFVGLCPFHSERTPSFSVSESKQLYHCYGCKKGGDLISFVMEILGISFPEAVEELAERARMALPQDWHLTSDGKSRKLDEKALIQKERLALAFRLNRFAAAYYHQNLASSAGVIQYLSKRGIVEQGMTGQESDIARQFYMGAAPDSWDALAKYLLQKKAPLDLAVELGLIRPSTKSTGKGIGFSSNPVGVGYFDLLRNRVLFPILNLRGKVAGFGGRSLGDEQPKYLNSPESITFQKSKLVFGLFQAQKHIREKNEVILVEGYFDVLALHAVGVRNVVATCGTSLTADHLKLLRRFASRLVVLFDGDAAGVSATERAMEVGLDQGWVLYGARLPEGVDPDDLVIQKSAGREAMGALAIGRPYPDAKERIERVLDQARPLLDSKIDEILQLGPLKDGAEGQNHQPLGAEAKSQALKKIGKWLLRFQDPVGRNIRIQYLQDQLEVSRSLIVQAMESGSRGGAGQAAIFNPNPKVILSRAQNSKFSTPGSPPSLKERETPARKINLADRILIAGIILGGDYVKIFLQAQDRLPPQGRLSDLLEDSAGKEWVETVISVIPLGPFSKGAFDDSPELRPEIWQERWKRGIDDRRIQSIAAESLVSQGDLPVSVEEFQGAISKRVARCWARFSQQIKTAIAGAEAKKNIELQSRLMKEYLDVQRKMKEFGNFYDEE